MPLELRREVKGLVQPEATLGSVEVEVTLRLRQPLLETYLGASMPGQLSKRAALRISSGKEADEEDIDFVQLRWTYLRIRVRVREGEGDWSVEREGQQRECMLSGGVVKAVGIALNSLEWPALGREIVERNRHADRGSRHPTRGIEGCDTYTVCRLLSLTL